MLYLYTLRPVSMKKYFRLLFSKEHRRLTILLLLLFIVFITSTILLNVKYNLPGILMLFASSVFLIEAFIHVSRNPAHYFILAGVCLGIIALLWFGIQLYGTIASPQQQRTYDGYIEEMMIISTFFICLPGILVGVIGGIYWEVKEKKDYNSFS